MNSILLFLAGLLALFLSALFAAPYFIDWNDYRDVFEAQASKLIGRAVDVGGDVSLSLFPAPVLRFETINVADAKGGFDTPFAAARSFTVWLSVPPLLRGTIEARSVEIDQPVLNLRIAKDGSGNWADIGGEAADLPFIPKDVALNSVEISGGTVNLWRGKAEPDSTIDNLDGELTARSLQGPYKFTGQFTHEDKRQELRFSTGRREEENGQFSLKMSLRSPETRETYSIDGAVRGLGAIPVFKGDFLGRLAEKPEGGKNEEEDQESRSNAPFEIKSQIFADFTGAQFIEAELSVTKNGKPQTVRGLLDMKFSDGLELGGTFSSRWVDLDTWIGPEGESPSQLNAAMAGLVDKILRRVSGIREGSLRLFLDQAVLAGDLITGVQLTLLATDGKLEVSRLSANLPGENKLRLSGTLDATGNGPVFSGPVSVTGSSLSRLTKWAGVAAGPGVATQRGQFSIKGKLSAAPGRVSLEEGEGNLFGSAFKGAFSYRGGAEGEVALTLKSDRLDLARVLGSSASPKALWELLVSGSGAKDGAGVKAGTSLARFGKMRAQVDISIAAVSLPGLGESALDAAFTVSNGVVDIRRLQLATGSDVNLQAGGRLTGLGDKPNGNLTLAVQVDTGKGLAALAEFLEIADLVKTPPERLAALTPVALTTAIRSAAPGGNGLDVQMEGSLGKSDLLVKLDFEGVPADWTQGRISLQGSLKNASGAELLQQLRPHLRQGQLALFKPGEGTASIEASGVAQSGLQTKARLNAGGMDWTMQGAFRIAAEGNSFSGTTALSAPSTAAGLSLLGVYLAPGHETKSASVSADLEVSGGVYRFGALRGDLAGAPFSGQVEVDFAGERPSFDVQISANDAALPQLLAPVIAWRGNGGNLKANGASAIRGVTRTDGYWPDVPFNAGLFARTDGNISLESERLRLTGGLVLEKARIQAALSGGTLKVSRLEGSLRGGSFKASGELATRGAGMTLKANAEAKGLRLERLVQTRSGDALVTAPADISLSVTGEGLTPRGLVAGLTGQGQLDLGAGKIKGFSLGAGHAAVSSARDEKAQGGADEAELGARVANYLKNSEMSFSQIAAPFNIRNGVLEFDKLALSDAEGRATITTYLQLSSFQLDSEWVLQSAEGAGRDKKPRVSLVFTGPVGELGRINPKIDTTGLARYVTIRKMEKDVERLEKLDVSGPEPDKKADPVKPRATAQTPAVPEAKKPDQPKSAAAVVSTEPAPPLPKRKQILAPPAAAPAQPAAAPPPVAAPAPAEKPVPAVAAVPEAVELPRAAPLPARKPRRPVIKPPEPELSNELPWLQSVTPPASPDAPTPPVAVAPGALPPPVPFPVPGSGAVPGAPPPPRLEPVTPPVTPRPVRAPPKRFDPFAETGN